MTTTIIEGLRLTVIIPQGEEVVSFYANGSMKDWWKWPRTHELLKNLFVQYALTPCNCVLRIRSQNGVEKRSRLFFDSIGHLDRIEEVE